MFKSLLATGLTILPFTLAVKASAQNSLYVFGDSLSDTGNIFNVTQAVQPFTEALGLDIPVVPPVPPYGQNGRFSNGLVWIDFLAQDLGIELVPVTELPDSPITLVPPGINLDFNGLTAANSVNFAFGGAQTASFDPGAFGVSIPSLLDQVSFFTNDLAQSGLSPDEDALYVMWIGGNDVLFAPDVAPEQSVSNVEAALQNLYDAGARTFLVSTLPDSGQTPVAFTNPAIPPEFFTQRTNQFNQFLETALNDLRSLPNIDIVTLDANSLFEEILADPVEFGFTQVPPTSCLEGNPLTLDLGNLTLCDAPDEHIFFDEVHPTTVAHEIIGDFALETLQNRSPASVPEPTAALPLGLLGLGLFVRKRLKPHRS
ncbi:MAG: SGNH/GDSL hydrolase family protein [Cyanophyceae cyanobacterium]